ncbi:MAG: hypothetical protein ABW224_06165 [Kibdelosporangium sp.]
MTSASGHRGTDRESAIRARDEAWHRGFADPDLEDEDPPARARRPGRDSPNGGRDGISAPGPGAFSGVDDRGVVTVTVDRAGLVADVAVVQRWREFITPQELGHALLTASNEAIHVLVADQLAHLDLDSIVPKAPAVAPAAPALDDSMLTEMADLISRFDGDIETYSSQLESMVRATATASGPNGKVRVSLGGGRVVDVTADSRWAARARHTEIRFEAVGAFRTATRQLGSIDVTTVQKPASLVRLQELVEHLAHGTRD